MNLEDIKKNINDGVLNLNNKALSGSDIDEIINLIIDKNSGLESLTGIYFSGNRMALFPERMDELIAFCDDNSFDFLNLENCSFHNETLGYIVYFMAQRNNAIAVNITIFQDNILTREMLQRFVLNEILALLEELDPNMTRKNDLDLKIEIAEKIKELLKDYLHQVTIKSDDDKDTKLINLTAKDPYSFDPRLIYKQIDGVIESYYSSSVLANTYRPRF